MSIPESFWTDDAPIGEVPPMNEHAAMNRKLATLPVPSLVLLDLADATQHVIDAARVLGDTGTVDVIFWERMGTLRDRLAQYEEALVASGGAAPGLSVTDLARGILSGGAA